jgi:hypothetical protein
MDVLLFLNAVLGSRLIYLFNDSRLPGRTLGIVGLIQVALCFLAFTAGWLPVLLAALLVSVLLVAERWLPQDWLNESRFAALLIILIALVALRDNLVPAPWFAGMLRQLLLAVPGVGTQTDASLDNGLWFLTGFLLVANEANLLIRSLFHRFHLEPRVEADGAAGMPGGQLDRQEYNAGRIIGILERWLMYSVLLVSQNINVVALLIAAKGFARFRQMDERAFAEYVLIGTLASTLLSVLIAQIIGGLSGG